MVTFFFQDTKAETNDFTRLVKFMADILTGRLRRYLCSFEETAVTLCQAFTFRLSKPAGQTSTESQAGPTHQAVDGLRRG
jgi:hypothetical protein